jgi:hypothetical protein
MKAEGEASLQQVSSIAPPIPVVTNLNCIEEQEQRSNAAKCERRDNESKRTERKVFSHAPGLGITSHLQKFHTTFYS